MGHRYDKTIAQSSYTKFQDLHIYMHNDVQSESICILHRQWRIEQNAKQYVNIFITLYRLYIASTKQKHDG